MGIPPKVSVIVPVYNRAAPVCAAIDSVLAQTFKDFELIVVDDGSTDATPLKLAAYGDKIKIIRQPNRGVSAARNAGIKAARGGLIAFLDSDDVWLPHKLAAQTAFFNANPAAVWQQTQEIWVRNGRRVNPKKRHAKLQGRIFKESLELCLVSPSAVMLRRLVFNEFGMFDETLPACEDYDLWLKILTRYPVYLDETPGIIKHGGHKDQLSARPGLDAYRIKSLLNIRRDYKLNLDDEAALVDMVKRKSLIFAQGCHKRGRVNEADYYLKLAEGCF